ncbi:MAG: DNA-formamidopyrimidine glycosylase [Candidatus Pacebacteria bacterium]|nr:DNA-formamidopyrimidine glycosylase [Candidatus Paceibacterota bacterium]
MPELPEVETIRKQLSEKIIGKKLDGRTVTAVKRRAKILIIEFADKTALLFHLKLTGQLILNATPGKYTRRVFDLSDGSRLVFNDVRKFAWHKTVSKRELEDIEKNLGPEPFGLTEKNFAAMLAERPRAKIKPLLMDQKFIAGIGNIYADEILFAGGIHPLRQAGTLDKKEIHSLFASIKKILKAAVRAGGSSVKDYLDASGKEGGFAKHHKVYQKTGQKCLECGGVIRRIRIGSRSAHFCPKCQK